MDAVERAREVLPSIPEHVLRALAGALSDRIAAFSAFSLSPIHERLTAQWLANVTLMWQRLEADRDVLELSPGDLGGHVVGARAHLGDPHAGGHTVCRLDLA